MKYLWKYCLFEKFTWKVGPAYLSKKKKKEVGTAFVQRIAMLRVKVTRRTLIRTLNEVVRTHMLDCGLKENTALNGRSGEIKLTADPPSRYDKTLMMMKTHLCQPV